MNRQHHESASQMPGGSAVRSVIRALLWIVVLGFCSGSYAGEFDPFGDFSLEGEETESVPVHPPEDKVCQSCHVQLPTIDPRVIEHSVHYDQTCIDCHQETDPKTKDCDVCHRRDIRDIPNGMHAPSSPADVPSCQDCHGGHNVAYVESAAFRDVIPERCAVCHEERYEGYMDRFHGQAAKLGMEQAPRCADCHHPHAPLSKDNPKSRVASANLLETCGQCHEDANENFVAFDPHPQPGNKEHSELVYYVYMFMQFLLAGVFGFFGLHTTFWLQRTIGAFVRGELPPSATNDQWVQRFTGLERTLHIFVNISFILLAMTGLPMMFSEHPGAQFLATLMGGQPTMRYIHFVCAGITFGYFTVHLLYVVLKFITTRNYRMFWGVDSMVPNLKDFQDLYGMCRWFLYLSPPPKLERWTYWEKFDYWAVFWGVGMIGVSGLLLANPELFSRILPGDILNVAAVIHGEEALLAVGFIFVFHFFHNHLRPENFPIDISIYTGRIPLERFKHERVEQYQRLVEEGKLDDVLVGPPSRGTTVAATLFGSTIVVIGLVLITVVFWTIATTD